MPVKQFLYILTLLTIVCACNLSSTKEKVPEDSLNYYPPTPGQLDKEQFRHYYRIIAAKLDSVLPPRVFNGAILVAKNGEILYEKYSGYADVQKRDSLTDTTAFHLASASKPFTAVAILRMVQEGKLSLDDSIQKFFPGLPYPGITIKTLLNHRSGLPNYVYFMSNSKWDKEQYVTNQDVVNFLYSDKPQASFAANTHFSYSNTNYVLLAMIIEKISGKTFPDYLREKFFLPLQMNHSYVFTNSDSARSLPSFNYNGSLWENDFLELTYGDKNLYSTPRDMLKWDQALYTDQVIRKSLLDSAFLPYSHERPSLHNYGLGFRLFAMPNGKNVVYHFGRWHGFNAAFARLPEDKATIIILGNKFNRGIYTAAIKCYPIFGDYGQEQDDGEEEEENVVESNGDSKKASKVESKK
jgi:CubicO group peptidase (beta-lactamase class C family)